MMDVYPPGIPDELFIRGKVPMTKAEVRAVTMSKARLRPGMRVLDIGAGTGSFTIEAALLCPRGEVVAVECNPDALALLRQNIAHFSVTNVTIIEGMAPEALTGIAPCDRIFIGGSRGHIEEIIDMLPELLKPGGWVVANTICLDNTNTVTTRLRRAPWANGEIVQVSVARGVPLGSQCVYFEAQNPVWVASAQLSL